MERWKFIYRLCTYYGIFAWRSYLSYKKAREENDKVIVSIFVNPIQFGPKEDYSTYPRDLVKDSSLCEKFGVDLIFNPETSEMYPNKIYSHINVDILTENLCGEKRPGHFQGVCTVLTKFLIY